MTLQEKITMVEAINEESDEEVISAFLTIAGNKICRIAYPFDTTIAEVPSKYETLQVEAACYLLNKRGAEGEISHNENGINRSYEEADLPKSMLRAITPMCGVVKSESAET